MSPLATELATPADGAFLGPVAVLATDRPPVLGVLSVGVRAVRARRRREPRREVHRPERRLVRDKANRRRAREQVRDALVGALLVLGTDPDPRVRERPVWFVVCVRHPRA